MKAAVIIGTRPEAIKLAPVVFELQKRGIEYCVVNTAQHPTLVSEMLDVFGIEEDFRLNTFTQGQSLSDLTARLLMELENHFAQKSYSTVIVQGDTTSAFVGALTAFYQHIPVAHVEAGLRTSTPGLPFPEEMNRRLISRISQYNFAPTARAAQALLAEGIAAECVFITGNTVIDAQHWIDERYLKKQSDGHAGEGILCTLHRRENWGTGVEGVCEALIKLVGKRSDISIQFILHPNPLVADVIRKRLSHYAQIELLPPQNYVRFLSMLKNCIFVISDSGGVVEEAPSFGKAVLITRDETERTEAIEAGLAVLTGTDSDVIVTEALKLIAVHKMSIANYKQNPFGDGNAGKRIVDSLIRRTGWN